MFLGIFTKSQIQKKAWIDAKTLYEGVAALATVLKISRKRLSNWINLKIAIPYEYAIIVSELTNISLERLSPFTELANKIIRKWRAASGPFLTERAVNNITCAKDYKEVCSIQAQSVMMGLDNVLISGFNKIEAYKAAGRDKIPAIVLDLEALLSKLRTLESLHNSAVISEKVAVGIRLEQLIGDRQGKRSNLIHEKPQDDNPDYALLRRNCDEVIEAWRTDQNVAAMVNFSSKDTYRRAKRVCLQGISALINAMDCKKISIAHAAKIAKLSKAQQQARLQKLGFAC